MTKYLLQQQLSRLAGAALLVTLTLASGCNSSTDVPGAGSYRTVPAQLGRDTDAARTLTARAAALFDPLTLETTVENPQQVTVHLEQAQILLKQALDADIMYGPAHNNLGQAYYHQQRYYEAAWEFEYAIKLMPHQPVPRNNLGLVFEATGQMEQAAEQYDLARTEEPDNPEFVGNLVRARLRHGDRGQETHDLLQHLVRIETRPQWRVWAEEQLHLLPPPE